MDANGSTWGGGGGWCHHTPRAGLMGVLQSTPRGRPPSVLADALVDSVRGEVYSVSGHTCSPLV